MNNSIPFSRRLFLGSTAVAALAPLAPLGCTAFSDREQDVHLSGNYIDAHVHVWSPETQRYPLAEGFTEKDMAPPSFTPDELFANCHPQGVTRIVLIQMSFYKYNNRYLLDTMAAHPGTFSGVAIVDESQPDVVDTLKRLIPQGVRGLRIYTEKQNAQAWGDSAGMKAIWSYAADAGISMCLLANPDALPAVERMCKAYPKTRVVIDHFARIGMKGPVQQSDLDALCRLGDSKQAHVKISAFYALGQKKAPYTDLAPMIRTLRDAYGASRLMWGSDCPFQVQDGHTYANSIALIRDRLDFLCTEDKAWMLRKTAERVFFGAVQE